MSYNDRDRNRDRDRNYWNDYDKVKERLQSDPDRCHPVTDEEVRSWMGNGWGPIFEKNK